MGQKNQYQSVAETIQAFVDQKTWMQADLARRVGITSPTLRKILLALEQAGMPLEHESEPPQAYWSVPKSWFPGGVLLRDADFPTLLRAVFEMPQGPRRKALLTKMLGGKGISAPEHCVVSREASPEEESAYEHIQTALLAEQALQLKYYSQSQGKLDWRTVSPQRLLSQPRPRLLAWCHSSKALRWFRVDNVMATRESERNAFIAVDEAKLSERLTNSVDGFHAPGDANQAELAFFVRFPEAAWVRNNLLWAMREDPEGSNATGVRVVCGSGGAPVVARFIVGLGDAATAEGEMLRGLVAALAEGALRSNGGGVRKAERRPGGVKLVGRGGK